MATIIEEFDAVKITNVSIQFFENGLQKPGTKFGCVGKIEGETELTEYTKKCEGVEVKKITKPLKMNNTVSAHIPIKVARNLFGFSNKDLKAGVYSYGADSKGKRFVLTADVVDEFQDITKLVAFSNCVSATGFKLSIENGSDELAELEIEFTAMKDDNGQFYYEALVSELDDPKVEEQWHQVFTPTLVKDTVPTP